jgi:hypothetical protein
LPVLLRQAAAMSDPGRILSGAPQGVYVPPDSIFGAELEHGWCYYYQKAELARQNKDWGEVVRLGETAFSLDDYPNDAVERLVFIEGSAHSGDWPRALELTRQTADISDLAVPPVCALWGRIAREAPPSQGLEEALKAVQGEFGCDIR